jgi:manganese/iron transport system permease protein/iron/zinc/copper transport system permease protein
MAGLNEIWLWLTEPFAFDFLRRAFVSALLIGALCGFVGVYVVLRRMSYIGHGLSLAVFGGAVMSFALGVNFYLGSTVWGFAAAMLIIWLGRRRNQSTDASIGVITTASFALGVILISAVKGLRADFDAALFGNILSLNEADLYVVIGTAAFIAIASFATYKHMLFATFSPEVAPVFGVRAGWLDALFALVLAALLIASMRVVGVTLIAAALITPPATARMLTHNFHRMVLYATLIGAAGGVTGVYASWYLDWATGATIVATYAIIFAAAFAGSNLKQRYRTVRA